MNFEEFRELIAEIAGVEPGEIQEDSSFRDDLAVDSLQMVNLVLEVSGKYKLDLQQIESIDSFTTVRRMYETFTGEVRL
ncbi:MAG TPA: phosphopantetheine-binding protein [Bacillales bacterium]